VEFPIESDIETRLELIGASRETPCSTKVRSASAPVMAEGNQRKFSSENSRAENAVSQ